MRAEYYNSDEEKIVLPDDDSGGQTAQSRQDYDDTCFQ